jgi:hypothetical protein
MDKELNREEKRLSEEEIKNNKFNCENLNSEKPNCYPYGYEQCKVNGKLCFFRAYGEDPKNCVCQQPKEHYHSAIEDR